MKALVIPLLSFVLLPWALWGQRSVGLLTQESGVSQGFTLFHPIRSTTTYLVDNCGREVHRWESEYTPGNSVYLLEDGRLLRTAKTALDANPVFVAGGAGERVQLVGWHGTVLWDFVYSNDTVRLHHDIEPLPNGNVLLLAWELITTDEALAAGRDPDLLPDGVLWSERLLEVVPFTNEIVWEWRLWDHLVQEYDPAKANYGVVAEHPELLDINFTGGPTADGRADWLHLNAVDYNPDRDEILLTSPFLNELYVIDHSTTTEEAAGHRGGRWDRGGDFLYRWGNPAAYDQGADGDRQFHGVHDARWIPAALPEGGNILVFNNGDAGRPWSTVDLLEPPVDDYLTGSYVYIPGTAFLPRRPQTVYATDPPENFFSSFLSGAQRLPNGNTLICAGAQGRFLEVTPTGDVRWDYINPITHEGPVDYDAEIPIFAGRNANIVFRCTKYGPDYPGLQGRDLTPGEPLERNFPEPYTCELLTDLEEVTVQSIKVYPVPARDRLTIELFGTTTRRIRIFDGVGRLHWEGYAFGGRLDLVVGKWPPGAYRLLVEAESGRGGRAAARMFFVLP